MSWQFDPAGGGPSGSCKGKTRRVSGQWEKTTRAEAGARPGWVGWPRAVTHGYWPEEKEEEHTEAGIIRGRNRPDEMATKERETEEEAEDGCNAGTSHTQSVSLLAVISLQYCRAGLHEPEKRREPCGSSGKQLSEAVHPM